MKTLKSFILPVALVLMATGSAFATNSLKKSNATIVDGYVYRPNERIKCVNTGIKCDTEGTVVCTADVGMGSENLRHLVGTSCPDNLYFAP